MQNIGQKSMHGPLLKEMELDDSGKENSMEGRHQRSKISWKTRFVVMCILFTEMCERLTYYGVLDNLVLFCTSTLELGSSEAVDVSLIFSGRYWTKHCV